MANGEKLGICSAVTYSISTKGECNIHNWAISCRYFEIGLEEFIILYLIENIGIKGLSLACEYNGQNSKLHEFIDKYYGKALCDDWSSVPIDCDISINHYGEYDDLFKRLLLQLVSSKCNFNVYIINQDLEAKNLLKYSGLAIKEVVFKLNFPSQSVFYKFFKARTGMTPTEYKNA